ncbi:MAG: invasion associated locus B family protein [Alphaproteobacteria bacterium]|nr:invasion associated locus B family protein [Alphaproteobacteria bacterium]
MTLVGTRFAGLVAGFAVISLLAGPSAAVAKPAAKPAAAPAAPAQAGAPKAPQVTDVKVFGDWTVHCYTVKSASPCEMLELRVAKKTGQRILGVLLAYVPSRDEHIMQISVPLGVALQNGLVLNSDTYNSGVLHFRRCDMQACYVEMPIDNQTVATLGRATKAQMQIVSVDGRKYNLVFSLDGFTQAHSALVELAKQKAVAPQAPATPADNSGAN